MNKIYGAIVGDILGSKYEKFDLNKYKFDNPSDIDLLSDDLYFTDDTVFTCAIMDSIINNNDDYEKYFLKWGKRYPRCGFSKRIRNWLNGEELDRRGYGNGAAMRVSPFAYANKSDIDVLKSTIVTHDTLDARESAYITFTMIKQILSEKPVSYSYRVPDVSIKEYRDNHSFSSSAEKTMPAAIFCYLNATSFESCIQNCIYLGGDTDTIAAIAGSFAAAKWGVPEYIINHIKPKLTNEIQDTIEQFKLILNGSNI